MRQLDDNSIEELAKTCKTPFDFTEELLNNGFSKEETIETFSGYYTSEDVAKSFITEIENHKSQLKELFSNMVNDIGGGKCITE